MTSRTSLALAAVELAWTLPDGHTPTDSERATLEAFTGWGALARAFDPSPQGEWVQIADHLEQILPADAFRSAAGQVDTSFFTPAALTDAVWQVLTSAGFTGGSVFEPGCGSGAFLRTAPYEIDATGVEIDPTSARIARLLTPNAEIIEGALEKTAVREGFYDAAIGNVPFSSVRVRDAEGRYDNLHNYFIRRAAAAVRPGGYVAMITSRYTMDSQHGIGTLADAEECDLIGAVRFPAGAFAESGTDAVTDLIVLRKRDGAAVPEVWADNQVEQPSQYSYMPGRMVEARMDVDGVRVARYWAQHPEHVAGKMRATGWDRSPLTVEAACPDTEVARAVAALSGVTVPMSERPRVTALEDVALEDADGRPEGSYHVIDGGMFRVSGGVLVPARTSRELVCLVELRDLAEELLALESDTSLADEAIAPIRERTLTAYETYVSAFGALNRGTLTMGKEDPETGIPAYGWWRPTMGGFRKDPGSALVMALEVFDQDTGEASPAPILRGRVNRAPERAASAATPAEALSISLGETGRVDLSRIAELLSLSGEQAARDALGDLIYIVDGVPTAATEALSGNVRVKRDAARRRGDAESVRYAQALDAVMPEDLTATDVQIFLGSPFVTPDDVETFLTDELGSRWPRVIHTAENAYWEVNASGTEHAQSIAWGVPDMEPHKLVEHALNNKMPEIRKTVWGEYGEKSVKDMQATAAAAQKLALIQDRFTVWVWEDDKRAERILRDYNQRLNSHVPRVFDGSHLTFPGMSAAFTPWAHQLAAVERIASSERALIAHSVGSGKTLTMVMSAMTLRRFGHAQKPMIVVPNHLLDQIAREAQQAFPMGRFLIATKDDLARDQRRIFAARCATGDWDAVIITHSAFGQIPVDPSVEQDWLADEEMRVRQAMVDAEGRGAKALARASRSFQAQMGKLRAGKNDAGTIFFEQLGVDYLMVDEAHLYRRLATNSKSRSDGMGSGSSKRATDLLLKIDTLAARKPAGAPVVSMFTGTPWSNTLAETWVWQRYLQPADLHAAGLREFDAWVAAFIRYETNIEVAPDGASFRMHRRPVGVVNVPELKSMLNLVADVLDPAELMRERPAYDEVNVAVQPSPDQRAFVQDLASRAEAIHNGSAGDDNMLVVCNDGRKVALDPRLVGIEDDSAKVAAAADRIAESYERDRDRLFGASTHPGGFQLVFMDLGTPGTNGSQTYGRLRAALVKRGIPAGQIRFVHEATTDKARAALFASCRDGGVSVLVASTAKAGMGTNVQTRLTDLHHVDAPWLPSDVIQRDGRAIRPGNLAGHVTIHRYVTEGTFDAYMWQALERKSRAFDALYATGQTEREIEDVSQATMNYGEIKALASGNPLLLEQAEARAEVKQLQVRRAIHRQQVTSIEREARVQRQIASSAHMRAQAVSDALEARKPAPTGDELANRARYMWAAMEKADGSSYGSAYVAYRGLEVRLRRGREDGIVRALVMCNYLDVDEFVIPAKTARRGFQTVTDFILSSADHIIDGLDDRLAELREREAEANQAAQSAEQVAESSVFDGEQALTAAVERLALIDAAITSAADAPEPVEA